MNLSQRLSLCSLLFLHVSFFCIGMNETQEKQSKELSITQQAAIGLGMGAADAVVSTPLTYLKNMCQDNQAHMLSKNPVRWYKGFATIAASLTPTAQVQNTSYETLKTKFNVPSGFAGPASGAFAALLVCPTDLILRHLQTEQSNNSTMSKQKADSTITTIQDLYSKNGARCFARGLAPTMARDAVYSEVYLDLLPRCKNAAAKATDNKALQTLASIGASLGLGFGLTACTHPFDMIQARMQKGKTQGRLGYRSMVLAARMIPREKDPKTRQRVGLKGYTKGFGGRFLLISASIFVLDGAKETLSSFMANAV